MKIEIVNSTIPEANNIIPTPVNIVKKFSLTPKMISEKLYIEPHTKEDIKNITPPKIIITIGIAIIKITIIISMDNIAKPNNLKSTSH